MSKIRILASLAIAGILAAAGWWLLVRGRRSAVLTADAAHVAVRWRGRYPGTMTLPARINWCPGTRRGILEAISGDSGVALVFIERDSLTSGPHAIGNPDVGATVPSPGATVVMRWLHLDRDTTIAAFKSQGGGTVRVSYGHGTGTGDFNTVMRSASNLDSLVVQGVFREVPVVTTAAGCN